MRFLALTAVLLLCCRVGLVLAEASYFSVRVAEPFIELYTGPGRGYPVFYVVDRGELLDVIMRRTDWFRVRTAGGKEGWVKREAMELTLTPEGEPTRFADADFDDFSRRRWEAGVLGGDFEGADVMSIYAAYAMTPNFSAELSMSQVFGDYSDALIAGVNLVAQPFPEWRVSPFFSLGSGIIYTDPNVTLVDENDRTEPIGNVGVGLRCYMTRRFLLRAEYRNYVIFQNKDDNQEIDGWQAGFAFFF